MLRTLLPFVLPIPFLAAEGLSGLITEAHAPTSPIRGAVIRIKQPGAPRLVAELETGHDGRFRAAAPLPAGDYQIEIAKPNHAPATLPMRLPAAAPLNVQLARYGAISGRVIDSQNRPLPGARILLMVAAEEDQTKFRPVESWSAAVADNAGNYRVFHLAPGRYALAVTWANMGSGGRDASLTGAYLYPSNNRPELFTIASGTAITGIDFTLPAQSDYTISGKVTGLRPNETAAVALALREQPSLAAALLQTNSEGEFRLDRVAPGAYHLRAAAPMNGYGMSGASLGDRALFGQVPIDVAGQNLSGVEIALAPPRSLTFSLQSTPRCPAVPITLMLEPLENWATMVSEPIEVKPSRESTVQDLAPGRYRIRSSKPTGDCFAPDGQIVDARAAGVVRLTLQPPGAIEAHLRVPGAVALTLVGDNTAPTKTLPPQPEGPYRFERLRPGRYRLQSEAAAMELDVRPGATTQAVLPPKDSKP